MLNVQTAFASVEQAFTAGCPLYMALFYVLTDSRMVVGKASTYLVLRKVQEAKISRRNLVGDAELADRSLQGGVPLEHGIISRGFGSRKRNQKDTGQGPRKPARNHIANRRYSKVMVRAAVAEKARKQYRRPSRCQKGETRERLSWSRGSTRQHEPGHVLPSGSSPAGCLLAGQLQLNASCEIMCLRLHAISWTVLPDAS